MKGIVKAICLSVALLLMGCGLGLSACEKEGSKAHHWSEWEEISPTCEEAGERSRSCLDEGCGEKERVELPATGHKWGKQQVTKSATCEEPGVRERKCEVCGKTEQEELPVLGHDWGQPEVKKPASCTETGIVVYTCNNCRQKSEERELDKLPHEWKTKDRKNPKCEEDGQAVYRCTVCGEEETVVLEALGHVWVNSGVSREATCDEPGMIDRTCSRCSQEDKREIPELGHSYAGEYTIDEPATFDHDGKKSYHCTRCGESTGEVVIPRLREDTPIEYEFRVFRNNGERVTLSSIVITVYDDQGSEVAKSNGATFSGGVFKPSLLPKTYTAKLSGLPEGFSSEETFPVEPERPVCDLYMTASVIKEAPGPTTVYQVGSVMHDFTVPASAMNNGKEFTLSKALEGKKMILLNFWFANCNPCKEEFPGLGRVYEKYRDVAEVAAFTPYDSVTTVINYPKNNGMTLSFPMGEDAAGLANLFKVNGYPTSVVIDREGVVVAIFSSSTSESRFENYFRTYTSMTFRGEEADVFSETKEYALPVRREEE